MTATWADLNLTEQRRVSSMPESMRKSYLKTRKSKSKAAAVKAFCQECMGYLRNEVRDCTAQACPMWYVRPYRPRG